MRQLKQLKQERERANSLLSTLVRRHQWMLDRDLYDRALQIEAQIREVGNLLISYQQGINELEVRLQRDAQLN